MCRLGTGSLLAFNNNAPIVAGGGNRFSITFDDQDDKTIELSGTIVKLSYHLHSDYSVHLKFSEILNIDLFRTFPCDWTAEEKF